MSRQTEVGIRNKERNKGKKEGKGRMGAKAGRGVLVEDRRV